MSSICKYCNKTELVFDNAYKSKSGKLIPLDKTSGLPHQCDSSPYAQQQVKSTQTQGSEVSSVQGKDDNVKPDKIDSQIDIILSKIEGLTDKVDHLQKLVYALTEQQRQQ